MTSQMTTEMVFILNAPLAPKSSPPLALPKREMSG